MGRGLLLALALALAGCGGLPWAGTPAEPEAIETVAEETAETPAEVPAEAPPAPEPPPEAAPPAPEPPAVVALRRSCAREGGTLARRGDGLLTCQRQTRDGGRSCTASRQCEGECLARSGTCAPVTPLYGCHEVLLASGSRVTQCLE